MTLNEKLGYITALGCAVFNGVAAYTTDITWLPLILCTISCGAAVTIAEKADEYEYEEEVETDESS